MSWQQQDLKRILKKLNNNPHFGFSRNQQGNLLYTQQQTNNTWKTTLPVISHRKNLGPYYTKKDSETLTELLETTPPTSKSLQEYHLQHNNHPHLFRINLQSFAIHTGTYSKNITPAEQEELIHPRTKTDELTNQAKHALNKTKAYKRLLTKKLVW